MYRGRYTTGPSAQDSPWQRPATCLWGSLTNCYPWLRTGTQRCMQPASTRPRSVKSHLAVPAQSQPYTQMLHACHSSRHCPVSPVLMSGQHALYPFAFQCCTHCACCLIINQGGAVSSCCNQPVCCHFLCNAVWWLQSMSSLFGVSVSMCCAWSMLVLITCCSQQHMYTVYFALIPRHIGCCVQKRHSVMWPQVICKVSWCLIACSPKKKSGQS